MVARVVAILAGLYLLLVVGLFITYRQPPERLSLVMARLPGPLLRVLPWRQVWNSAREGSLKAGDLAPDFELQTLDASRRVRLSSFRGRMPVVLVFGSYT